MSKTLRSLIQAATIILTFSPWVLSQDVEVRITVDPSSPKVLKLSGRTLLPMTVSHGRSFSFMPDHAGIDKLGERFRDVLLTRTDGTAISAKKVTSGHYLASDDFVGWSYAADLSPLSNQSAAAHISWVTNEGGIVMLADLLPEPSPGKKRSAKIIFDLPDGWRVSTVERNTGTNAFAVADTDQAVFFLGSRRRERTVTSAGVKIHLSIAGDWLFDDEAAAEMAGSIFADYVRMFGSPPAGEPLIAINRFPTVVSTAQWDAETRGRTITIISSDMPFRSQSLQRIHEQLRHEMFHLWFPNGVILTGSYDWFYEGFALYASLKIGVLTNRIRFEDYLDTLSRTYDFDRRQAPATSLIEASRSRWSGSNTHVYARGMLVAFLCDLALLERSKGKKSIDDLLRTIYDRHKRPSPAKNGNQAVLSILHERPELSHIIDSYIVGSERLDMQALLGRVGIESETPNAATKLSVTAKPTGRQKDLLNKLGYNNWRNTPKRNR